MVYIDILHRVPFIFFIRSQIAAAYNIAGITPSAVFKLYYHVRKVSQNTAAVNL